MRVNIKQKLTNKQKLIIAASAAVMVVILALVWVFFLKAPRSRVTFDPDNGGRKFSAYVNTGNRVEKPAPPVKDGYSFSCWSEDGENEYDFSLPVEHNLTLKALYLKICKVEFMSDGEVFLTDETVEGGKVLTPVEKPVKEGFVFDYWEIGGERYDFSMPVTRDIQIDAHFAKRIPCLSVSFRDERFVTGINETKTLNADSVEILPADCTDKPEFSIDDASVAVLDANGNILGVASGTTQLRVKCGDRAASVELVCSSPVEIITLDQDVYNIEIGESIRIVPEIEPEEASVYALKYYVDDGTVAYVEDDGTVTGRKGGTTKLTVLSSNGIMANATINVDGCSLVMSGLDQTFFTYYDPAGSRLIPVDLIYDEWKNGVESINYECLGAMLQCSIDAIRYKDGCIYQAAPVNAAMSSELYFTFLTSKSNSVYVVCEPTLAVKSADNLKQSLWGGLKVQDIEETVTIHMNCTGSWNEPDSDFVSGWSNDDASCSFVLDGDAVTIRFVSSGGQSIDITVSR
ncbi:MAG: InlB B-repeat-containing protein [Oscillospiraceae bacterium]|nr:InlB B-repeat-containing protein [Oscillospiraceae bacterium]